MSIEQIIRLARRFDCRLCYQPTSGILTVAWAGGAVDQFASLDAAADMLQREWFAR